MSNSYYHRPYDTMNGFIVLISICLALTVYVTQAAVLVPYPTVMTAVFTEQDIVSSKVVRLNNLFLDVPNKRAKLSIYNDKGARADWSLIFKPSGADPISPPGQGYTLIGVNTDANPPVPNNCFYESTSNRAYPPYPGHWKTGQGNYEVGPWFPLPDDLVYNGEYFIPELGVMSDRWDSTRKCNLTKSGIGLVPCTSVMMSQDLNPLPLSDIRAFGAPVYPFNIEDVYSVRFYRKVVTSVQDSDFELPNNWQVTCGSYDRGFSTWPFYQLDLYSGVQETVELVLRTPPLRALGGRTKVYFRSDLSFSGLFNCSDCVQFEPNYLEFTLDNWQTAQQVTVTYKNDGCSLYEIVGVGGGYDWVQYTPQFTFWTCHGSSEDGCDPQPVCGKSDWTPLMNN